MSDLSYISFRIPGLIDISLSGSDVWTALGFAFLSIVMVALLKDVIIIIIMALVLILIYIIAVIIFFIVALIDITQCIIRAIVAIVFIQERGATQRALAHRGGYSLGGMIEWGKELLGIGPPK